jgi:NAD(P)H-flavin reductase
VGHGFTLPIYREAIMKQEMMTIVRQQELAPRIYELVLAGELVKEMAMPGQFLHIRVPRSDLLLRRPISINQYDSEKEHAQSFIVLKVTVQNIFLKWLLA